MQRFFLNLTNEQFVSGLRDRSEPRHTLAQNNDLPFRLYLLQQLSSGLWPFAYDTWSGDETITAIASLRDISNAALLASTAPLTPIKKGFEGLLHTNTLEIDALFRPSGSAEKEALLSLELVDAAGHKLNPFRRAVILRATPGNVVSSLGAIYYFSEVTTYLGAGPEALQSKPTVGRVGARFEAWIDSLLVSWRVQPGAAETDLDLGYIRPLDFDAATNAVNLVRGLGI